jgi:phosphatidylcholine synthase
MVDSAPSSEAQTEGLMRGGARLPAWAVHLLTASGAVLAMLALAAVVRGDSHLAFVWLFAALVIDGLDGTLARAWRVKEREPRIDGDSLDLVVDYLTYVFVPAFLVWRGGYLPDPLAPGLTALILLSSLYTFARTDMKTSDGYFRGFPALWMIVAFYFFILQPSAAVAAATVLALSAGTFAPIHFVHPFRVRDYGPWLPAVAVVWAIATAAMLIPALANEARNALLIASLASALLLVLLGLWRSVRGPRTQ